MRLREPDGKVFGFSKKDLEQNLFPSGPLTQSKSTWYIARFLNVLTESPLDASGMSTRHCPQYPPGISVEGSDLKITGGE